MSDIEVGTGRDDERLGDNGAACPQLAAASRHIDRRRGTHNSLHLSIHGSAQRHYDQRVPIGHSIPQEVLAVPHPPTHIEIGSPDPLGDRRQWEAIWRQYHPGTGRGPRVAFGLIADPASRAVGPDRRV